jgi:hypothetical protein
MFEFLGDILGAVTHLFTGDDQSHTGHTPAMDHPGTASNEAYGQGWEEMSHEQRAKLMSWES